MEFISAKKFLSQPKEVQQVFLDWWKPAIGDLYSYKEIDLHDRIRCKCIRSEGHLINLNVIHAKDRIIPLFTEGQLRSFIEEQTEAPIQLIIWENERFLYIDSELLGEYESTIKPETKIIDELWKLAVETASATIRSFDLKTHAQETDSEEKLLKAWELEEGKTYKVCSDDTVNNALYCKLENGNLICKGALLIFAEYEEFMKCRFKECDYKLYEKGAN